VSDSLVEQYLEHFRHSVLPHIADSAVVLTIQPRGLPDTKICLEIGAALLLDKPLLVISMRGNTVPARLRLAADEVVEIESLQSADSCALVRDALSRIMDKRKPR
jgi:hypothetical protein